jgi:DNA-binding SARP family transcriptional activator
MPLVIRTFGPMTVDGFRAPPKGSRHVHAMFAVLATLQGREVPRKYLAELLWTGDKARSSLSQLLYSLKAVLPTDTLSISDTHVELSSSVSADFLEFSSAMRTGDYASAVELYRGHFLEGAAYVTDAFDDWRVAKAARLEADVRHAFDAVISQSLELENHQEAAARAKRALLIFPLNERLTKLRCELLASSGSVSKAITEANIFRRAWTLEKGTSPTNLSEEFVHNLARMRLSQEDDNGRVNLPLIGRNKELAQVRKHLQSSSEGCRVAVLSGEAGIGKSRILQHTLRRAVLDGARVFLYTCSEVESRLPYSALAGLIREGYRNSDKDAIDPVCSAALAFFTPELFPTNPNYVLPNQRAIWEAVAEYFDVITRAGQVAIGVDNYHWMDENSRELLIYVSKRLSERPMFLIYAGRGLRHVPTYEDAQDIAKIVEIRQLSSEATRELIDGYERKHDISIDAAVREVLLDRIGGRPFYLLEALRDIEITSGGISNHVGDKVLSSRLAQLISDRLAALPDSARSLIAAAAVLNREAPVHLLARIAEIPLMAAADHVSELVSNGILADSTHVGFAHDLMREGALGIIRHGQRSVWHLRVADSLVALKCGTSHEIALHYEEAGDTAGAYTYASLAATEAMRLHAYSDAEAHYVQAMRHAPAAQRDVAELQFLHFVGKSGRYTKLLPLLPFIRDVCIRLNDHEGSLICAIASFHALEYKENVDFNEIVRQAKHVVQLAEEHSPAGISRVMWLVADHIKRSGDFVLLERFARMLVAHAEDAKPFIRADMLSVAALLSAFSIDLSYAKPLAHEAVLIAEDSSNSVLLARTLYARGTVCLWDGDLGCAEADYERAWQITDDFAPDGLVHNLHANSAVLRLEQGRLDEAEHHARTALHGAISARRAYSFGNLALINLRRGDYDAVRQYASALLETHCKTPQAWIPVHATALLGLVDLLTADFESAQRRAAVVAKAIESGRGVGDTSHLHLLCARIEYATGNQLRAIQRLRMAADDLYRRDYVSAARLTLEAARLSRSSGGRSRDTDAAIIRVRDAARLKKAAALLAEAEDLLQL